MGMPEINIVFSERAKTIVARAERGTLGIILKEAAEVTENPMMILDENDIPDKITKETKEQLQRALIGNDTKPQKIIVYFIKTEDDYEEALSYFEKKTPLYLCVPTAKTDGVIEKIQEFLKKIQADTKACLAIVADCKVNNENIINFCSNNLIDKDNNTYSAEEYCTRVAGMLAGTTIRNGATYAILPELEFCDHLEKKDRDAAIDAGKLILFDDGQEIKIARAVNSATTGATSIRVTLVKTLIQNDIRKMIAENYIGRYANTYDNRCILLAAIETYLDTTVQDSMIESGYTADFNLEKIKEWMKENDVNYSDMTDDEIIQYNTGKKVFVSGNVKILDMIEDFDLEFTI